MFHISEQDFQPGARVVADEHHGHPDNDVRVGRKRQFRGQMNAKFQNGTLISKAQFGVKWVGNLLQTTLCVGEGSAAVKCRFKSCCGRFARLGPHKAERMGLIPIAAI